jgi:hypothetical protein
MGTIPLEKHKGFHTKTGPVSTHELRTDTKARRFPDGNISERRLF